MRCVFLFRRVIVKENNVTFSTVRVKINNVITHKLYVSHDTGVTRFVRVSLPVKINAAQVVRVRQLQVLLLGARGSVPLVR